MLRFFLTDNELERVGSSPSQDSLLRLWTKKEAIFKADPYNARSWFSFYELENTLTDLTTAVNLPDKYDNQAEAKWLTFETNSIALADSMISIAFSERTN